MATPINTSSFLRLPPEIRNQIYSLAYNQCYLDVDRQYHEGWTPAPGLVMASKRTYHESLALYYDTVCVVSRDPWIVEHWLLKVHDRPQRHGSRRVKQIRLDCRNRSEEDAVLCQTKRFLLSHHSKLSLSSVREEVYRCCQPIQSVVDVRVCIVAPNQDLIWTSNPLLLHGMLEHYWSRA